MAGCLINANTRDRNGKVVESKLWKDLLSFTSNDRKLAKSYYSLGTDMKFLEEAKKNSLYKEDENGQITLNSLRKIAKLDTGNDKMLNTLEKRYSVKTDSMEDAMSAITNFNSNPEYKDDFVAVMRKEDAGYKVEIRKNTPEARKEVYKNIKDNSLQMKLISLLNEAGADVSFLRNEKSFNGRYSTENAVKNARGLYNLITISTDAGNVDDVLAEECGHFIAGMLDNSPLMERLDNLLDEKVIDRMIEAYGLDPSIKSDSRELKGVIIGRALIRKGQQGIWSSLVDRLCNLAKSIASKIRRNDVEYARLSSERYAMDIAKDFFGNKFSAMAENALGTVETKYNRENTLARTYYTKTINSVKEHIKSLKTIDPALSKEFRDQVNRIQDSGDEVNTDFDTVGQIKGILAIRSILELYEGKLEEYSLKLMRINTDNDRDFVQDKREWGDILREARMFAIYGDKIRESLNSLLNEAKLHDTRDERKGIVGSDGKISLVSGGTQYDIDLQKLYDDFVAQFSDGTTKGFLHTLLEKEDAFYQKFLTGIYGKDYIVHSKAVMWGMSKEEREKLDSEINMSKRNADNLMKVFWADVKRLKHLIPKTHVAEERKENISMSDPDSFLRVLNKDNSFFNHAFGSMCNSDDMLCQLTDIMYKSAERVRDLAIIQTQDKLKLLYEEMKDKLGTTDTEPFFEYYMTEVDGKQMKQYTGYLQSAVRFGEWENEFEQLKLDVKNAFKKKYPDSANLTKYQREKLFVDKMRKILKAWHKGETISDELFDEMYGQSIVSFERHSMYNKSTKKYQPNTLGNPGSVDYTNYDWNNLSMEEKEFIGKFRALKEALDENNGLMPHTNTNRMPQFTAGKIQRLKNRMNRGESLFKALSYVLRDKFFESWAKNADDFEYGSMETYNDPEELPFQDDLFIKKEIDERVPLFGIRLLPKEQRVNLNTDLFDSMMAYSMMAMNYNAMNNIFTATSIGKRVSKERSFEKGKADSSRAYSDYCTYMDKTIFSVKQAVYSYNGTKILLNKLFDMLGSLGTKLFLGGGTINGLFVNGGTGALEIIKTGLAGEDYDRSTMARGFSIYFGNTIGRLLFNGEGKYGWGKLDLSESVLTKIATERADEDQTKLDLLIRRWDVLHTNDYEWRNWKPGRNKLVEFLINDSIMLPYKMSDHFMQSAAYLFTALGTKLIDADGNQTTLFDAYKISDNEDTETYTKGKKAGQKITAGKRIELPVLFKDRESYDIYQALQNYLRELGEMKAIGNTWTPVINDQRLKNWLIKNNVDDDPAYVNDIDTLMRNIEERSDSLLWTEYRDEIKFAMKAGEVNNRMHGIYNTVDSTWLHSQLLAAPLIKMKGYVFGLIQNRFSPLKKSLLLDRESEGYHIANLKAVVSLIGPVSKGHRKALLNELVNPLNFFGSKKLDEEMEDMGFNKTQVVGIHKFQQVTMLQLALYALAQLLYTFKPEGDDEDEDSWNWGGLLYYITNRLWWEQSAFDNPYAFSAEYKGIFNLMPLYGDALKEVFEIIDEYQGAKTTTPEEDEDHKYYYAKGKKGMYKKGDPKWETHIKRYLPYIRDEYTVKHGYEKAKSFDMFKFSGK